MKKGIEIKQPDMNESGAACLASISVYYNLKFSLAYIQLMHSTHKPAKDISGLVELAQKLDFSAKGVKCTFEALNSIPKPVIAQVFLIYLALNGYLLVETGVVGHDFITLVCGYLSGI